MTNAVASSRSSETAPPSQLPAPGATAFHESSQYRRWRFSEEQLRQMRREINGKTKEVISQNIQKDKVSSSFSLHLVMEYLPHS
jgi:hypothetical protein